MDDHQKNVPEEIIRLYKRSVSENVLKLKKISTALDIDNDLLKEIETALNRSSEFLIDKWLNGVKYLRTMFALNAIPSYPGDVLEYSVNLDAIVNICDDIVDENLSKEERGLYIFELARVLSRTLSYDVEISMREPLEDYFNKLLLVIFGEKKLYSEISNTSETNRSFHLAYRSYLYRSVDMDIFIKLPLIHTRTNERYIDKLVEIGRIFRMANLFKKDINDMAHDIQNNQFTPVLYFNKNKKLNKFYEYFKNEILLLRDSVRKELSLLNEKPKQIDLITDNFNSMLENELKLIEKLI